MLGVKAKLENKRKMDKGSCGGVGWSFFCFSLPSLFLVPPLFSLSPPHLSNNKKQARFLSMALKKGRDRIFYHALWIICPWTHAGFLKAGAAAATVAAVAAVAAVVATPGVCGACGALCC